MKCKATSSDNEVSEKGDEEDLIMAIPPAIEHPLRGKVHEQQVRQGVDYFRRILGGIIVLFTPIQGRRYRCPVAFLLRRVWHGREPWKHAFEVLLISAELRSDERQ